MLRVSDDFRRAIYDGRNITRVMLRFGDTILDSDDINMSAGIQLTEPFNLEEELTVGACPAATLDTTIKNYHGLLSGFDFGECEASLGIVTHTGHYGVPRANVTAFMRYGTDSPIRFDGWLASPFLTVNGTAPTAQPPFPVHALWIVENTVYCIGIDGDVWLATWIDGRSWDSLAEYAWDDLSEVQWDEIQGVLIPARDSETWQSLAGYTWDDLSVRTWNSFIHLPDITPFMRHKFAGWAKRNRGITLRGNTMHEFYSNGTYEEYEFANLGVFIFDTPKKRKLDLLAVTALDRMRKFDIMADNFLDSLTYPITIGTIFEMLCDYVEVPRATISFINSDRVFDQAPLRTENVTCREVLSWIAEAACAYARMTRDGAVELAWFGTEEITIPMNQYFSIDVAEYEVMPIDKLHILNAQTDIGVLIGTGDNAYLITDNPYLYGATDAEIRRYGAPIYYRLTEYAAIAPIVAAAVCDWSIQAGDMISIDVRGTVYKMPIYRQSITWKGGLPRVVYENTGAERRPVEARVNRRTFAQRRAMHEITVDVNGIRSRLTGVEGDVAELEYSVSQFSVRFVTKDGIISAINLTPESAKIQAGHISLEGLVTVNGNFRIDLQGNMWANNGTFAGTVNSTAGNIAGFTLSGSTLTSSGLTIDTSGRVTFGSLASLYSQYNRTVLQSNSGLHIIGSPTYMGAADGNWSFEVRSDLVVCHRPLSLWNIPQNSGSGYHLVYNFTANQVEYLVSSIRYKKNIRPLSDDIYDIRALKPVIFAYNNDLSERQNIGFIAEEAVNACPLLGITREVNGQEVIESIDYQALIPILVREIQKLWAYIEGERYGTL